MTTMDGRAFSVFDRRWGLHAWLDLLMALCSMRGPLVRPDRGPGLLPHLQGNAVCVVVCLLCSVHVHLALLPLTAMLLPAAWWCPTAPSTSSCYSAWSPRRHISSPSRASTSRRGSFPRATASTPAPSWIRVAAAAAAAPWAGSCSSAFPAATLASTLGCARWLLHHVEGRQRTLSPLQSRPASRLPRGQDPFSLSAGSAGCVVPFSTRPDFPNARAEHASALSRVRAL